MRFEKEEYPYKTLEKFGFKRSKCKICNRYFWSKNSRDFCDDDDCRVTVGLPKYGFIGDPVGNKCSYLDCWKKFIEVFEKFNHKSIKRYPVVARWREDVFFVEASIYDFQPYCVSGEVEPPANPLIIPQFCLRFNDLENIGVTGRHYSGFIMVGEHVFNKPDKFIYFKEEGIEYIHKLMTEGFEIPEEEIFYHEDSWEGGGNAGPCIEFFVRGLELGNQVYMQYRQEDGELFELETKVIDMGAGLERFAWITNGTKTSYEVVFPEVLKFLKGYNLTEKEKTIVADHTRTLLIALYDGALPSNVSGGYNLRKILRECFSILRKNKINLDLSTVISIHAKEFKIYPELVKMDFKFVRDVLEEEQRKYTETLRQARNIIEKTKEFDKSTLEKLYQSHGITLEIIKEIKPEIKIPIILEEIKTKKEKEKEEIKYLAKESLPETEAIYYQKKTRAVAKVLKIIGDYAILDKTVFYPQGGGQQYDLGLIGTAIVKEVVKKDCSILHKFEGKLKEGEVVEIVVDKDRRKQLMQHHTGAHIINGACRRILGEHAQQAGAGKKVDSAHLDIFHYKTISDKEMEKIEELSNKVIKENRGIIEEWLNRNDAEQKYGFQIYQGGAVPGREIRIINIKDWDVEACGGLHLNNTEEAEIIIITKVKKIQDSISRIEFLAGSAARSYLEKMEKVLKETAEILECSEERVLESSKELFNNWKEAKKK